MPEMQQTPVTSASDERHDPGLVVLSPEVGVEVETDGPPVVGVALEELDVEELTGADDAEAVGSVRCWAP